MANDGGMLGRLEEWIAATLTALQSGGADVFRTAAVWKHQIAVGGAGVESFDALQPFAFAAYAGARVDRQGDGDLRQIFEFAVLIGVASKEPGVCRIGDASNLGTSKIRELVIGAMEGVHPGTGFTTDEFNYVGEDEFVDLPTKHGISMRFEIPWINVS
jgi:hypothetical protein